MKHGVSSGPPCVVLNGVHRNLTVRVVNKGKAVAVSGEQLLSLWRSSH